MTVTLNSQSFDDNDPFTFSHVPVGTPKAVIAVVPKRMKKVDVSKMIYGDRPMKPIRLLGKNRRKKLFYAEL